MIRRVMCISLLVWTQAGFGEAVGIGYLADWLPAAGALAGSIKAHVPVLVEACVFITSRRCSFEA